MILNQKSIEVSSDTFQQLNKYKLSINVVTGRTMSLENAILDLLDIAHSKEYMCVIPRDATTIYGLGRTGNEAKRAAYKYLGENRPGDALADCLVLECTPEVFAYVNQHGGIPIDRDYFSITQRQNKARIVTLTRIRSVEE